MASLPPEVSPDPRDISRFRRYIEAALAHAGGTHTFEDVQAGVTAGTLNAWPGVDSIAITEIIDAPQRRSLHFFIAGGNLAELEAMEAPILEWGKANGCTHTTLTGRRGWERTFLTRGGWAPKLVVFEKSLV